MALELSKAIAGSSSATAVPSAPGVQPGMVHADQALREAGIVIE